MEITIEKLTKEKFQEFGDVLSLKDNYTYKKINNGYTNRYDLSKFITNEKEINNNISISIFQGLQRPSPLIINMLECHPIASQSFMPLQNGDWLIIVSKGNSKKPNLDYLKCFIADTHHGVNYYPGTWHHPLITLEKKQDFLVVDRDNIEKENLTEFWFDDIVIKY